MEKYQKQFEKHVVTDMKELQLVTTLRAKSIYVEKGQIKCFEHMLVVVIDGTRVPLTHI